MFRVARWLLLAVPMLTLGAPSVLGQDAPIVADFDIEVLDVIPPAKILEKQNNYLCSLLSEKEKPIPGSYQAVQLVDSLENAVAQLASSDTVQPPAPTPRQAPPADKVVLTWIKSVPAGVEFTKSEITVSQYRACVEKDKCTTPQPKSDDKDCNWGYSDRDSHPVNCVDWNQATAYCGWAGGRLPTEDEWFAEASKGGERKYSYPWGDTEATCDYAVMAQGGQGCGRGSTWPVCSKEKGNSVSGLCDLSGNVWEWTSSWFDNTQKYRIVRGGAWDGGNPSDFRASSRDRDVPTFKCASFGFRCARPLK